MEIKAREPIYIEELEQRVEEEEKQIQDNVQQRLIRKVPEVNREQSLIDAILEGGGTTENTDDRRSRPGFFL